MTRFFPRMTALAAALAFAAVSPAQEFRTMKDMEGREVTFKADPARIEEFANPIFSAERIIEMNPDNIVLVDGPAPDKLLSRFAESPLTRSISAVKNGRVHSSGQLFWWGDAKLMLPVQLMIYAKAHYQLEDVDIRRFHADYLAELFGIGEEDAARLLEIQKLGHLPRSE